MKNKNACTQYVFVCLCHTNISVHIYTIPKLKPFSKYFVLFLNHYATGDRFFFCESKRVVFTKIGKIYLPFNAFECANVEYWDANNKRNFTGKKVFFIQYLIYVFSLGFAIESHLTQLQINENPRQCGVYK